MTFLVRRPMWILVGAGGEAPLFPPARPFDLEREAERFAFLSRDLRNKPASLYSEWCSYFSSNPGLFDPPTNLTASVTIWQRSSYSFDIVTYYIKWVNTSWTDFRYELLTILFPKRQQLCLHKIMLCPFSSMINSKKLKNLQHNIARKKYSKKNWRTSTF